MSYPDQRDIKRGAEPLFTVRAQDALAVPVIEAYADICEQFGLEDQAKHVREEVLPRFKDWQDTNRDHTKLPRYNGGMKETL